MNRVWEAAYLGLQLHLQEKQTKQTAAGREIHGLRGKFTVLDSISSLGPASAAVRLSPSYVTVTPNNVRTHPPPPPLPPASSLQPPAFLGPANRTHTRPSSSPVDGLSFLARRTSSSLSQRLFPFGKADVSLCCDREFPCSKRFIFTPPMSHKPKHKPPPSSKTQTKCSISLAARKNNSNPKVEPAVLKAEQGVSKVGQRIPMAFQWLDRLFQRHLSSPRLSSSLSPRPPVLHPWQGTRKGIALCGQQLLGDVRTTFDMAFTFIQGNMDATVFLYLIKAGYCALQYQYNQRGMLRVDQLSADRLACGVVVASLRVQLGIIALNGAHHSEAVEHFTATVKASTCFKSVAPTAHEAFTVLFGWDTEELWQISNQKLILALLGAGMLREAFDLYRFAMDASNETTKTSLHSRISTLSL
ncbi:hypothetical protein F4604DRAFT_1935129 [Suillus subluteus]|nr:hypothetical protein F4604DRAFT_1935129 [Suillus subluteus]